MNMPLYFSMFNRRKAKTQGFCWDLVSQTLLEITGIITPILLAGVGWLVFTLPQQLNHQDTQIKQVIDNQKEFKDKIYEHDRLIRLQEIRLTKEELRP
jgi:hypothetical protein